LAGNWPEIAPNAPFLPDIPVGKCLKTNDRLPLKLHGMEEVVGSIPTRSTKSFHRLSRLSELHHFDLHPKFQPKIGLLKPNS
jgi:hypothetical protein